MEFSVTGYRNPQCSACFINSVDDSLDSILTLAKTEGMLFKWGSGTGTNLSSIRGSMETLSGGGTASGPLASPPPESVSFDPRMVDKLVPVPEPHLKSMPSVLASVGIDYSESSTELMKQAEHCGFL